MCVFRRLGVGKEKCVCLRITRCSRTLWPTVLLDPGKGQSLNLEPLVKSGFPFHTAFVPSRWLSPPGRTSVGTVPVSLPLQALAFLNVIWLFLWAQCKDASGERKYLMPQQFFKAKKKRLLNLGTLSLKSSLPGVGGGTLYRVYQSVVWAR